VVHKIQPGDVIELVTRYRVVSEASPDGVVRTTLQPVPDAPVPAAAPAEAAEREHWPDHLGPRPKSIQEWAHIMSAARGDDEIVYA
jgi:hypothetical protein